MRRIRFHLLVPPLLTAVGLLTACGGEEPEDTAGSREPAVVRAAGDPSAAPPTERWNLSPEPVLEIGVVEGEEPYQLHRARSSVRLDDGRIVIVNAGSQELRYFDPDGRYLFAVGGNGEGPGEFRYPTRIRRTASADSLAVWDQSLRRMSIFHPSGEFQRIIPVEMEAGALFPLDEWIAGRNWIDSPVTPEEREPILEALGRMPPADTVGPLRMVYVTRPGWIWVAPGRPPADEPTEWHVYDLDGTAVAAVEIPARFEPHELGEDYVLGRYQDEMDVDFIRLYDLQKPAETRPVASLAERVSGAASATVQEDVRSRRALPEEHWAMVSTVVKNMASLQEIYYADHYSYTENLQDLSRSITTLPEEVEVVILYAGLDGWLATMTHRESGALCLMAYGYTVPMGWVPGMVICPGR